MAEIKKAAKVVDTWKQKRWYHINSPFLFGSRSIGETAALDDSGLIGRTVKMSLSVLTGDVKKQNTSAVFEVTNIKNGMAETIVKRLEISPSSIRRMIRKGKDRIDLSILCATKDNVIVRIKPFLVTRGQTGGSVMTRMRNMLDALLRNEVINVSYDNLIKDILSNRLQKRIKDIVGKIYPVRTSEIRVVEKAKTDKPLPPIPPLPVFKEESSIETEEEKVVKKAKEHTELQKLAAELTGEKIEENMEAAEQKPDIRIKEKKAEKPKEEAKEKKPKAEKKVKFKEEAKE